MKILYVNTKAYDYLTATLVEGLQQLGCEVWASEASNYAPKIDDALIPAYAEQADLIVVGSNMGVRTEVLRGVRNPRLVFVDGNDFQGLLVPEALRFKMIFKRELGRAFGDAAASYVFPLPFAAERRYFTAPPAQKDILITFLADLGGNPLRYSVYQRVINLRHSRVMAGVTGERAYSNPPGPMPIETPMYREALNRSVISINVPGLGYDCARYWEILAARAMLLTFEPDIVIPESFSDGVDCVSFRTLEEFEEKVVYYGNHVDLATTIAQRGHERLLAHHTTKARASYFLALIRQHIDRSGFWEPPRAG
ncbi:MAG: glycosyltransferase family 1 protein [Rhodospirillaceae bacterium]|nr:glycosyltransferase family 1 protein [Rhodospirillaceae bacterium]